MAARAAARGKRSARIALTSGIDDGMIESPASTHLRAMRSRATPLPGAGVRWLEDARAANAAAFERNGFPSQREEAWRYTSLKSLERRRFAAEDPSAGSHEIAEDLLRLPAVDGTRVVLVNGLFRPELSRLDAQAGLSLTPLVAALARGEGGLQPYLSRCPEETGAGFCWLNTAFAAHGTLVRVAPGVEIAAPLHLVHVGVGADADVAWHARHIVELGAASRLTVVEHYVAAGAHRHFGNVLNQVALAGGSALAWVRVDDDDEGGSLLTRTEADLGDAASFAGWSVDVGAGFARHELALELKGTGARGASRGVFALHGRQHSDHQLSISHAAKDTTSDVDWRGVADQRARGVFHGGIVVRQGADGSDAKLQNRNLLLSPHAEIDTKPVLEIHADEVKAAHGATVGQLDERAMFYLRTRGIPAATARNMLTFAFCRSVLDELPIEPLREHLATLLMAHLPRAAEDTPA